MKDENRHAEAGEKYAAAHDMHYTTKDLREAIQLYRGVMAAYPDTEEAGYSRSQIQNIVNTVVPKQDLLDVYIELALAKVGHPEHSEAEPEPDARQTSEAAS